GRDLRGFLDHVERMQGPGAAREADAPVEGVEPDTVRLMSIHAAKGLEFPVVCVADLGRMPQTAQPTLLLDGARVGLRLRRLDGAGGTPTLSFGELEEEAKSAGTAEEDRILYVAMTRARERLLLSGAADFERWKPWQPGAAPIGWVAPALSSEIPELASAGVPQTYATVGGASALVRFNSAGNVGTVLRREAMARRMAPPRPFFRGAGAETSATPPAPQLALLANTEHARSGNSTFSYTSLSELDRCGYRYYVERVLHIGEERSGGRRGRGRLEARARGTLVHALMEQVDFRRRLAPQANDLAALAAVQGANVSDAESEQILALLTRAIAAPLAERIAAASRVRMEHPFAFALGSDEPLVVGVLDLLAEEPDGVAIVVDYKSDRVSGQDDLEAVVTRDYEIQRLLYALAALRGGAREVEIVHWFLERPLEPVAVRFSSSEVALLNKRVNARVEVAREGSFTVAEHPHEALCSGCPARGSLCSWPLQATEADAGGAPSEDGEAIGASAGEDVPAGF
ncbi:MAG TPA: PD-(D/E)XK nuclease family protein, partial [Solirubrobacteraceae bacterium]|nr:PD-(D/E)XK nuclease family protein [Solirubrobacteraceae bacterium]